MEGSNAGGTVSQYTEGVGSGIGGYSDKRVLLDAVGPLTGDLGVGLISGLLGHLHGFLRDLRADSNAVFGERGGAVGHMEQQITLTDGAFVEVPPAHRGDQYDDTSADFVRRPLEGGQRHSGVSMRRTNHR